MRARSAWLSHPKFKATWVALAAGSLAGLAVLGACSQDAAKIAGTRPVPDSPRLAGIVGGNAHVIKVCSDLTSTGGPITVNVAQTGGLLELNAVDPDRTNTYQYNFGPYTTPDVITSSVTISPNECKTVFQRNNTCPAQADCTNPLNHLGNRLWTNESNTSSPPPGGSGTPPQGAVSVPWPNIPQIYQGIINPYAKVSITAVVPNGYTMDNLVCVNDDVNLPQTCVNGGNTSANVFHGSVFTYTFTAHETPCPAGEFSFSIADEVDETGYPSGSVGDLLIKYDQFPAPNDNSYGVNSVGWPSSRLHRFKDLTNSDHAGVEIRNASGQLRLSFDMDYLSEVATAPSRYASRGVTGGDGQMRTGTATGISVTSSLANNLNNINISGLFNPTTHAQLKGSVNVLVDSPPTNTTHTDYVNSDAALAGWDFRNTYYARIKLTGTGANPALAGFDPATWTVTPNAQALHNSPEKACPVVN